MSAPGQPGYPGPGYRSPWFVFRFFCLVAAICEFIASLCFAGLAHGPAMAWVAGGLAAFFLAWAAP